MKIFISVLLLLLLFIIIREKFIPVYVSYRSRDTKHFNDYYSGVAGII